MKPGTVKVLCVIGARLNSSRLPGKHLLDLSGQPMIARIFQRLEQIPELDHIVLATSADEYNRPLVDWAKKARKHVFAFEGDVNDLVGRMDAIVNDIMPQIVVYVCGDSPLIEPATVSRMIQGLLTHSDADYVCLKPCSEQQATIHVGFSPYRYSVWRRIVTESKTHKEREHVGLSKKRFIDTLRKLEVNDDPIFCRSQHRISVDTPSDYRFMAEVYRRWYAENDANTLVSLPWVIEQLERDSILRDINEHVRQRGVNDESISVLLVTQCGHEIGLGHLMRMLVLARTFQDTLSIGVCLLIQGETVSCPGLDLLPHRYIEKSDNLEKTLGQEMLVKAADAVVFDLAPSWVSDNFDEILDALGRQGRTLIGIDGLFEFAEKLDLIHVPSFYLAPQFRSLTHIPEQSPAMLAKVSYGWKNYLLPQGQQTIPWQAGNKLLVMTGGSDTQNLGEVWPTILDDKLPIGTEVHWVQGPFAHNPKIPEHPRLNWVCHHAPVNLKALMTDSSYALTLHGVSFFELLQLGIPVVTLSPGLSFSDEMDALAAEAVAVIANSPDAAVTAMGDLMRDTSRAQTLADNAHSKIRQLDGGAGLVEKVLALVRAHRT